MFRVGEGAKKKEKPKKQGGSMWYYEDEDSLNLDIGMIKKFNGLRVTAPLYKPDLAKAVADLKELREALQEKGDLERKETKARFMRRRGEPGQEGERESGEGKARNEKFKVVDEITAFKKKQQQLEGEDKGMDIDTYEATYGDEVDGEGGEAFGQRDAAGDRRRGGGQRGRGRGGNQRDEGRRQPRRQEADPLEEEFRRESEDKQGDWGKNQQKRGGKQFTEMLTKKEEWPTI